MILEPEFPQVRFMDRELRSFVLLWRKDANSEWRVENGGHEYIKVLCGAQIVFEKVGGELQIWDCAREPYRLIYERGTGQLVASIY